MDDFYDLLEVSENASRADIKRAWRGKAREYHPDVNDDARASVQFKTLRTAYEVLSDETKRAAYDRMGHERYVADRLDGLPTAGMTRPNDGGGDRWRRRTAASRTDASSAGSADRSGTGGANRSSTGSTGSTSTAQSASAGSASARSSAAERSDSTGGSTARSSRSRASRSRATRTESAGAGASSGTAASATGGARTDSAADPTAGASNGASAASATSTPRASSAPRSLWYAWVASFVAGVAYLGGLAAYLRTNAAALSSFAAAVEASPGSALLADAGLVPPGAFALGAVGSAPGPALAFPLGAVLLAVAFLGFAARFRHGTAGLSLYLYPLGALAPLASFALGPVVAAPAGLTLALVVAVPVLTVTVFLADVGRTLFVRN